MALGKYFWLIGCCILGNVFTANAAVECGTIPKCMDLGYGTLTSSCPAGFVGCPFHPKAAVCDREADTGDFKYISVATAKNGWVSASTTYNNRFIVGAGTTSYCGVSDAGGLKAESYPAHTHGSVSMPSVSVKLGSYVTGDGAGEGEKNFDVYTGTVTDASKLGDTTETYTSFTGGSYRQYYAKVLPFHKNVRGAFYSSPLSTDPLQISETIASSTPKCADLGYVDTVSNCPGTYVKCPFDQSAVMCDLQAQAGEIKFSLQSSDHNGWLLCNGSPLFYKGTDYERS